MKSTSAIITPAALNTVGAAATDPPVLQPAIPNMTPAEFTHRKPGGPNRIPGTWHLLLGDGTEITGQEQHLDTFYPGWRSLPELAPPARQWIVTSVWPCRGLWYFRVHAVDRQQLLEIAPHYKGHRSQVKVLGMAAAAVELLTRKYPQAAGFPVVREDSPEHRRLLADAT